MARMTDGYGVVRPLLIGAPLWGFGSNAASDRRVGSSRYANTNDVSHLLLAESGVKSQTRPAKASSSCVLRSSDAPLTAAGAVDGLAVIDRADFRALAEAALARSAACVCVAVFCSRMISARTSG